MFVISNRAEFLDRNCDKCRKPIRDWNGGYHYGLVVDGTCSPGFGSKWDCDAERYSCTLVDGEYCYECLDANLNIQAMTNTLEMDGKPVSVNKDVDC